MRLATIRTASGPRAAVFQGGRYIDLQATDAALPASVRQLLEQGPDALQAAAAAAASPKAVAIDAAKVQLLAPIPDPPKIVCLGLNYRDHAAEGGQPIPKEPVLFSKYPTALVGHEADIVLPPESSEVDYEAELVIVVGKGGRRIKADQAMSHVAGYTCGHDVSARDWQLKKDQKQWMAGKTFDTFAPCGPVIVTTEDMPDPHLSAISLRLNGKTMQNSNTNQMIFRVEQIVSYISQVITIEPGDLIFTGTPPGVGMAQKPNPVWLKPGDVCEVEIEGIGVLRNPVVGE